MPWSVWGNLVQFVRSHALKQLGATAPERFALNPSISFASEGVCWGVALGAFGLGFSVGHFKMSPNLPPAHPSLSKAIFACDLCQCVLKREVFPQRHVDLRSSWTWASVSSRLSQDRTSPSISPRQFPAIIKQNKQSTRKAISIQMSLGFFTPSPLPLLPPPKKARGTLPRATRRPGPRAPGPGLGATQALVQALQGHVAKLSQDQCGCRVIQKATPTREPPSGRAPVRGKRQPPPPPPPPPQLGPNHPQAVRRFFFRLFWERYEFMLCVWVSCSTTEFTKSKWWFMWGIAPQPPPVSGW